MLAWKYYEGKLNKAKWVQMVQEVVGPAAQKLFNLQDDGSKGKDLFVLRDNAPQSHATTDGRAAEKEYLAPVKVLEQPSNSPDMQPLDYGFWSKISRKMKKQEREWQKRHPKSSWNETLEEYKARLQKTAMRLTKREVDDIMGAMPDILQDVIDADGGHIQRD